MRLNRKNERRCRLPTSIVDMMTREMYNHTVAGLHAYCCAHLPSSAAPCHATVQTFLWTYRYGPMPERRVSPAVRSWIEANAWSHTRSEMWAALKARFPANETPGQFTVHRVMQEVLGKRNEGRMHSMKLPALRAMAFRMRDEGAMLDTILDACRAAFPDTKLSRSALHRALVRHDAARPIRPMPCPCAP